MQRGKGSARSPGHLRPLDGLRGVAILLVFLFHAIARPGYWFLNGGFLGVDLFFVLSGFLITMLLVREWDRNGKISLPRFYRRRALRLLPALAAMLVGFVILTTAVGERLQRFGIPWHPRSALITPLLLSAGYVSNIAQGWLGQGVPSSVRQLWSLATEEQFYLLWPALLILALRFGRGRTRPLVLVVATLAVSSAATRLAMALAGVGYLHLYFAPETTFDELFIGCLFGVWFVRGAPGPLTSARFRGLASLVSCAFIGWAVWSMNTWADARLYRYVLLLFALASGMVIFAAATDTSSVLARALSVGPLRYFGRISYALYLWHPLVFWFMPSLLVVLPSAVAVRLPAWSASRTVAIAVAIVIAALSTRFVEQPFLRRKEASGRGEETVLGPLEASQAPASS